ncbi:MAG: hypothetical protein R3247_07465 [Rhodothermales bacterium]|nr:hypothetical protein [Rhodothermales bacterium]
MLARNSFPASLVLDPFRPTGPQGEERYRYRAGTGLFTVLTLLGVGLLVVSAVGWAVDSHQFYFSYLVGWTFCLSITLGALFFVLVQHLTKARWVVTVRRIPEVLMWSFPLLAVLFIPILFGMHDLYHWTHEELYDPTGPAYDEIVAGKRVYLNTPFWILRVVFYFVIWILISHKLYRLSLRQDVEADREIPAQQRKVSAWGTPLFAITTAFASYDLLMSLDPHWFSTIFGVYFFGGSFLSALSLIALVGLTLQQRGGMLRKTITAEHYHDLGKLMFGFTVFWAYIAFSQYMLIWYGNIPEETIWYEHRLEHGWGYHSAALLLLHFVLPFLILLPRATKRTPALLAIMCVWLLIMQWFDLHWLAMPVLHVDHAGFHWLDFSCWLGLFCIYLGVFGWRLSRHPLVPQNDPYLADSLHFQNA